MHPFFFIPLFFFILFQIQPEPNLEGTTFAFTASLHETGRPLCSEVSQRCQVPRTGQHEQVDGGNAGALKGICRRKTK